MVRVDVGRHSPLLPDRAVAIQQLATAADAADAASRLNDFSVVNKLGGSCQQLQSRSVAIVKLALFFLLQRTSFADK